MCDVCLGAWCCCVCGLWGCSGRSSLRATPTSAQPISLGALAAAVYAKLWPQQPPRNLNLCRISLGGAPWHILRQLLAKNNVCVHTHRQRMGIYLAILWCSLNIRNNLSFYYFNAHKRDTWLVRFFEGVLSGIVYFKAPPSSCIAGWGVKRV